MRLALAAAFAVIAGCAGPASSDDALLARARRAGVPWEADDVGGLRPASPFLLEASRLLSNWRKAEKPGLDAQFEERWAQLKKRWLAVPLDELQCEGAASGAWHDGCSALRRLAVAGVNEAEKDPPELAARKLVRARESAVQMMASGDFIMLLWGLDLDQAALMTASQRSDEIDSRRVLNVEVRPSSRRMFRIWSWHRIQIARNAAHAGGIEAMAADRKRFGEGRLNPLEWLQWKIQGRPRMSWPDEDEALPIAYSGWPEDERAKRVMRLILRMDAAILERTDRSLVAAWNTEEAAREESLSSEVIVARWSGMAESWARDLRMWNAASLAAHQAAQASVRPHEAKANPGPKRD
jgi:hypothetical protein